MFVEVVEVKIQGLFLNSGIISNHLAITFPSVLIPHVHVHVGGVGNGGRRGVVFCPDAKRLFLILSEHQPAEINT